jgi:hypothetical protein
MLFEPPPGLASAVASEVIRPLVDLGWVRNALDEAGGGKSRRKKRKTPECSKALADILSCLVFPVSSGETRGVTGGCDS